MKRTALLALLLASPAFAQTGTFWNVKVQSNTWTRSLTFSDGSTMTTAASGSGSSSITTQDIQGIVTSYGYLTTNDALLLYQPLGVYLTPAATNGLLLSSVAASTYQPIGSYLSPTGNGSGLTGITAAQVGAAPSTVTNVSLAPYLLSADAAATYQPVGSYVTSSVTNGLLTISGASATYQPIGSYLDSSYVPTDTVARAGVSANAGSITALQSFDTAQALTNAGFASSISANTATGAANAASITLLQTGKQNVGLALGLPPGSGLVYGSTNDALLAGISGANSYWDELQFSDTTQQRARWVMPSSITARYAGGALTNQIWWRGTSTVGAVVWQVAMVGRTNSTLVDVAYQNTTVGSNTVSATASNLNLTTIVLTPTNCPAGSLWLYELQRLPANASDTMVNDARVITVGVNE